MIGASLISFINKEIVFSQNNEKKFNKNEKFSLKLYQKTFKYIQVH